MSNQQASSIDVVRTLWERLKAAPFPQLGRSVGDFVLYDSLMAGCVATLLSSGNISLDDIPVPDAETELNVNRLQIGSSQNDDESAFLAYFEILTELRSAMIAVADDK